MQEEVKEKSITKEYITNFHRIKSECDQWRDLSNNFATPLLDCNWFFPGIEAFSQPGRLAILSLKSDGQLKALAPLASKGEFLSHLEFIGSSSLQEPGGLLYDGHESLEVLIQEMLDIKKPLCLTGLDKSSLEVEILNQELRKRALTYEVKEKRIPYVEVNGDWESFEKTLSSSRRSSFRRLKRKAEKVGEVQFNVVAPDEENVDQYLDEVFRIEAAGWKGRMGTAMERTASLKKFFTMYARRLARQGNLHLFFMKVGEENIAMQMTAIHSNRLWIFKVGYNEKWSWCSPGILLMHYVVQFCFNKKLECCEFLGSDEEWLHIWSNGFHYLVSYSIYPKSIKGITAKNFEHAKDLYIRATQKMKRTLTNNRWWKNYVAET